MMMTINTQKQPWTSTFIYRSSGIYNKKLQPENYGQNLRKIPLMQVIVSEVAVSKSEFDIPANEMKNIYTLEMLLPCSLQNGHHL